MDLSANFEKILSVFSRSIESDFFAECYLGELGNARENSSRHTEQDIQIALASRTSADTRKGRDRIGLFWEERAARRAAQPKASANSPGTLRGA